MTDEQILELAVDAFCIDYDRLDGRFTKFARAVLAAGASEGQEPVAWMTEGKYPSPRFIIGNADPSGVWKEQYVPLYLHPSAELTALRERIAGMEALLKDCRIWVGVLPLKFDDTIFENRHD